jgi:hypothetical protein
VPRSPLQVKTILVQIITASWMCAYRVIGFRASGVNTMVGRVLLPPAGTRRPLHVVGESQDQAIARAKASASRGGSLCALRVSLALLCMRCITPCASGWLHTATPL